MPVRIAIIGASFARRAWLPAFAHIPDAEVVAIASARLESARAAASQFGISSAYDDWRGMLERHQPDLVCIATPTSTHAPMTLAALDAGAHVLCEKPMAMASSEAQAMLAKAREAGRYHAIDHELRYNPNRRKIKELIEQGHIGRVRHVQIVNVSSAWGDPASRPEGDWWSRADMGGGRLGANGSHQIDLIRYWCGRVKAVSGTVATLVPDRIGKDSGGPWRASADDFDQFTLELASGGVATVLLSGIARHDMGNHTQIFGSEGTILLSDADEVLKVARAGGPFVDMTQADPNAELPGVQKGIWTVSVVSLLQDLVGAIREGRAPRSIATFEDGVATQRVMDAVRASSRERRWIDLECEVA
jgi:predicted dehydrogenase